MSNNQNIVERVAEVIADCYRAEFGAADINKEYAHVAATAALKVFLTEMLPVKEALELSAEVSEISSDWSPPEYEIDGELVSIYQIMENQKQALAKFNALEAEVR